MRSIRWRVTLAALAAVVLVAGLVAAAGVRDSNGTVRGVDRLGLSQLGGPQPAEAAGEPATTTSPGPPAASLEAPAPPLPGHRTPGAAVVPFQAGRTEWSGVSNGISLHLTMTTPSPRAGEPVTFVAEAAMPGALCCGFILEFGDGGEGLYPPPPGAGQPVRCADQEPKSGSVRAELRHVYNKAGRWNFSLGARSGGICKPGDSVYGSLEGTLAVGAGSSAPSAQGPAVPTVRPASEAPYERYVITLMADAKDDDGYIDRLIVDWGDGSATQTFANPQPCRPTASGWPGGSYTILPLWMGVGSVTHRYRDDGPYKVTVTAVSTGCDRTAEQRAVGTLTFPEPLPAPPPIESIPWPSTPPGPPPPIPSLPVPPPGPPPSLPPIPPPIPSLPATTTSLPAKA